MDLLLDRNGSNVGTNCSIASEIVFYVPHNDLSSFSILRAVERRGINFGSFFLLSKVLLDEQQNENVPFSNKLYF
jgi:hypothetical protein